MIKISFIFHETWGVGSGDLFHAGLNADDVTHLHHDDIGHHVNSDDNTIENCLGK